MDESILSANEEFLDVFFDRSGPRPRPILAPSCQSAFLDQFEAGLASDVAEFNLAHLFLALWPGIAGKLLSGQEKVLAFLRGNAARQRIGDGRIAFRISVLRDVFHRLDQLHSIPQGLAAPQIWPALARGADRFLHAADQDLLAFLQSPAEVENFAAVRRDEMLTRRKDTFEFGADLVEDAIQGRWGGHPPWLGERKALGRLLSLLLHRAQNPLLIGESGVGKSSLVYGLAHHIAYDPQRLIPAEMWGCRIYEISASSLLAGTGNRGDLETKIEKLIRDATLSDTVILFFDEIHMLLDPSDENARKIGNALKPVLADGRLRCIGATTRQEYDRFIANDPAMASRFRRIEIPEPDDATVEAILLSSEPLIIKQTGHQRGVTISAEARVAAVELSREFMPTESLPGKAVKILKAAVAEKVYALTTREPGEATINPKVGRRDVALAIETFCGLPVDHILDPHGETRFTAMEEALLARVVGQDPVVKGVVKQVKLHARGFSEPGRPVGVFLFLGPPGVGKSELAKLLATHAVGREDALIVKDMNSFKGEQARSMFIGASAGYVGYNDTTLFSLVRTRPNTVLVLDEIEKAEDCFPLLLSVFMGSAEDARHLRTDFSKSIIVMTSNALRPLWGSQAVLSEAELRAALVADARFPAELVNRIDRVFMFAELGREQLGKILLLRIRAREARSRRPLPGDPGSAENVEAIVEAAIQSGDKNGRGIVRALNEFLYKQL